MKITMMGMNKRNSANKEFKEEFKRLLSTDRDFAEAIKWLDENFQKYGWRFSLFLIRVLYRKVIDILEGFCNAEFWFEDPALNYNYVAFLDVIESLLKKHEELKELQKSYIRPFDNLIGDSEDYGIDWDEGGVRRETYRFYGEIENLFIKSGRKFFGLPKAIENKLEEIDGFIAEYEKISHETFQKFLKKTAKQLYKQNFWGKNVPPHIKKIIEEDEIKQKQKIIEENKKEKIAGRPFCITEKGWGYLKFNKYTKKIKIGKSDSRQFRLLQCLLEPIGVAKTIESVFEAIKKPKDEKDPAITSFNTYEKKGRILTIIENTIKELQRGHKLEGSEGKLTFKFDNQKTKIWIEYQN